VSNLYANGTQAQREKYLPKLCSGEWKGALAMSEPGAGSDVVGSMQCKAELRGDVWVANGNKMWITNGPEADVLIVYMRTAGKDAGSKCMTAFLVEKGMKGFSAAQKLDKLGMRGSNTCELVFENCEIPQENVLGEVNNGVKVLMSGLNTERLVLSGGPIGLMQAAMDITLPYVRERKQFDQAIGMFGLMQGKVADMYTALQSSRAFAYQVARDYDAGHRSRIDAASCLLHASESAVQVTLEAIQSLGGNGYINEYPTGRLLRDAKLYAIGAGTNEIRRMLIGRELFAGNA
jgi:isovaleryl-CoA dehydrogenase